MGNPRAALFSFILTELACLATGQTTSDGLIASQDKSFSFPITGPSSDLKNPWGINASHSALDPTPFTANISIYYKQDALPGDLPTTHTDPPSNTTLTFPRLGNPLSLNLGLESTLTYTSHSNRSGPATIHIPTVPFGLTLGLRNAFPGSLTLNGYYDSNRLNASSWQRLYGNDDYQEFFLYGGLMTFVAHFTSKGYSNRSREFFVHLDVTEESVLLPPALDCEDLVMELSNTTNGSPIAFPDFLLQGEACRVGGEQFGSGEDGGNHVIMGLPFFQAVYVYTERNSTYWIAQAGSLDLPPKAERFEKGQRLVPPSGVPYVAETSAAVNVRGVNVHISIGSVVLFAMYVILG